VLSGCCVGLLVGVLDWSVDPDGVGQIEDLGCVGRAEAVRVSGVASVSTQRRSAALSMANPKCTSAGVCSPMLV